MEVNKERDPKTSKRLCHKKYFLLKKCMHCLYTKVCQNYFPIEELSAQVYTPRWVEEETALWNKALKNQKNQNTKKGVAIFIYFTRTINNIIHYFYQKAY